MDGGKGEWMDGKIKLLPVKSYFLQLVDLAPGVLRLP